MHGSFLPQDENGFILNTLSLTAVQPLWQPPLSVILAAYQTNFPTNLHSIYLRGSVARGLAVPHHSDIDLVALIENSDFIRWQTASCEAEIEKEVLAKFPFVAGIEMNIASYASDFYTQNPRVAMVLKTQSLCLWGESILPTLPPFLPSRAMCLNHQWLEADILAFQKSLVEDTARLSDCQAMMKIIVRTGFELTVERVQKFTNDLDICCATFCNYYPNKSLEMRQALQWFLTPTRSKSALLPFLASFGQWLIEECEREF